MKNTTKLWLALGLLISAEFAACVEAQETDNSQAIVTEIKQYTALEVSSIEENVTTSSKTVDNNEHINAGIKQLFTKFFDENDTMLFSDFAQSVIEILKTKRSSLDEAGQAKCDKLITTFETNKHNYNLAVWAQILVSPNLLNLLPEESRNYIFSVPNIIKVKALMQKLRNRND